MTAHTCGQCDAALQMPDAGAALLCTDQPPAVIRRNAPAVFHDQDGNPIQAMDAVYPIVYPHTPACRRFAAAGQDEGH